MPKGFRIVFNDESILAVEKIAKILIHSSPKNEKITLTNILEEELSCKLYPCHRLDRETTGIVIYAKDKKSHYKIYELFKKGTIKKKYIAFVKGKLKKRKGVLSGHIIDKEGKKFKENPKAAKTLYKTLRTFRNFSVVRLAPLTGRTNQLRIQLAKIGNPILGERKYAFGRDFAVKFRRLALHAYYLSFIHPLSKERVNLEIGLPKDMKDFLREGGVQ